MKARPGRIVVRDGTKCSGATRMGKGEIAAASDLGLQLGGLGGDGTPGVMREKAFANSAPSRRMLAE